MSQTKDLSKEPPRSPGAKIHGYPLLARMIDKGRASLAGTQGEYHFACPLDQMLVGFKGVSADAMKDVLASGATDEEVAVWFEGQGTPKTAEEVSAWNATLEQANPSADPEKKEWFAGECAKLGLDPEKTTLFQYLDKDDEVSFKS